MASLDLAEYMALHKARVEAALDARLPAAEREPRRVHAAMRHAVLSGGKRLRPVFALAVCDLTGRGPGDLLDTACAIEFVHAASLILDDLPCMDDAQSRRGRPCTHVQYGKATALLATMALMADAFDLVAANAAALRPECVSRAVSLLSEAIGTNGLVHGQHLDLALTGDSVSLEELNRVHALKAGALFLASVQIPALLLGVRESDAAALADYARQVGLAFQITDDLQDAAAPREDAGKSTFAHHLGAEGARERAHDLISGAVAAIAPLGDGATPLRLLAEHLRGRIAG